MRRVIHVDIRDVILYILFLFLPFCSASTLPLKSQRFKIWFLIFSITAYGGFTLDIKAFRHSQRAVL